MYQGGGVMQEAEFIVDGQVKKGLQTKKSCPFLTPIKITDTMDENQKTFFANYNNMQKELIKNGLMDSK
jgi:hypothetical protein